MVKFSMLLKLILATLFLFMTVIEAAPTHNHYHANKKNINLSNGKVLGKIKSLAGNWKVQNDKNDEIVSFEIVSGGTAVMERIFGMINVYHDDGDRTMMTHYCSANNQPRMIAVPTVSVPINEIDFKFYDITNNHNDSHIRDLRIEFVDKNNIIEHWSWNEKGNIQVESFSLKRINTIKKTVKFNDQKTRYNGPMLRLEFALIYAKELQSSIHFYQKYFDFKIDPTIKLGPGEVYGLMGSVGAWIGEGHIVPKSPELMARASVMFRVKEIFDLYQKLLTGGVELIQSAPVMMLPNEYWFQFKDPSGNIIDVLGAI